MSSRSNRTHSKPVSSSSSSSSNTSNTSTSENEEKSKACLSKQDKASTKKIKKCSSAVVETGTKVYSKNKNGLRELASVTRMPKAGGLRPVRFLIDSRDRDVSVYPSANNFQRQFTNKMKLVLNVELASAQIPLLPACTERYVIITEDHCSDALETHSSIMFGTTSGPTGCEYPRGVIAMIPLHKQWSGLPGSDNYVWWQNGKLAEPWPTNNLQGANSAIDRLYIRIWIWDPSHSAILYPLPAELPPPAIPNIVNNVTLVFILLCET